jgi:hypothetical protein
VRVNRFPKTANGFTPPVADRPGRYAVVIVTVALVPEAGTKVTVTPAGLRGTKTATFREALSCT